MRRKEPSENTRRRQGKREDLNICEQGSSRQLDRSIHWCMAMSVFFLAETRARMLSKKMQSKYSTFTLNIIAIIKNSRDTKPANGRISGKGGNWRPLACRLQSYAARTAKGF